MAGARIGDYVVEQDLGIEETGIVYLGRHVVLPRHAELKVMHASDAWIRDVAVQMLKEACLVEALSHPGIPRVYECGVLPDRRPWTAFEHIEGDSIGSAIASGPMAVADVVVMIRDVADILDHAHHRGVMHRRLTPESLIQTPRHRFPVRVRGWGHACAFDATTARDVDPRDDVYALGVIAFRALTGARAESVIPPGRAHEPTTDRYPGTPRDVAELVDCMLAKERVHRPPSSEVRERAKWLADTLELVPAIDRPRWTPPRGLGDAVPPAVEDPASGFAVRITGRPRTR